MLATGGIRSSPERAPAIAREHAEARRRRARHHGLDFVVRPIRLAERCLPRRFLGPVRARVPAMARQIDAAAERQLIVDDDDLLMVQAPTGWRSSKPNRTRSRHAPAEPPSRERIALERVEGAVVPRQDVATKCRPPSCDICEQLVEPRWRGRPSGWRDARQQIGVGVDIPAENEHRAAGVQQRPPHQPEIVGGILNAVEAVRALDSPAVSSWLDDRVDRRSCGRSARLISHASVSGTATNSGRADQRAPATDRARRVVSW